MAEAAVVGVVTVLVRLVGMLTLIVMVATAEDLVVGVMEVVIRVVTGVE